MTKIREIVVFAEDGEPRKLETWSNVPYFLVRTFESQGIIVNTVNLAVTDIFQKLIRKIWNTFFSVLLKNKFYTYSRSYIYYIITKFKIKKAVKKYPDADAFIFITFSFSSVNFSAKPNILFCDWNLEHLLKYYFNREPNYLERMAIERQNNIIEKASLVVVLFPLIARAMKERYFNPNIKYNGNVINSLEIADETMIPKKKHSERLLFVGTNKYLTGAKYLIKEFQKLKDSKPGLTLDIIGINSEELDNLPYGVSCHGYLNKGIKSEKEKYYKLLANASIFINTTPKWGAFSASLEAMYFYTPVIVAPYNEFTETFGNEINFGSYYSETEENLSQIINELLESKTYTQKCLNSHETAREHTWEKYVSTMINQIEKLEF